MSSMAEVGLVEPPKPPKPTKPALPFIRFCAAQRKDGFAGLSASDASDVLGAKWKAMSDAEKGPYTKEYEMEKELYLQALAEYHNSDGYRQWLAFIRSNDAAHSTKYIDEAKERERASRARAERVNPKDLASVARAAAEDAFEAAVRAPEIGGEPAELDCFHEDELVAARIARNQAFLEALFDPASGLDVPDWEASLSADELAAISKEVLAETEGVKKDTEEMETKHKAMLEDLRQKRKEFEAKFGQVCQARQFEQMLSDQFPVMTRRRDLEEQGDSMFSRDSTLLKL